MTRRRPNLPAASQHLLLALLDGEQHGYALMRHVEESSGGTVRMGPGTLYGTLNRLVDDDLITETTSRTPREAGDRRRYYELTGAGRNAAIEVLERYRAVVERNARHLRGPGLA